MVEERGRTGAGEAILVTGIKVRHRKQLPGGDAGVRGREEWIMNGSLGGTESGSSGDEKHTKKT